MGAPRSRQLVIAPRLRPVPSRKAPRARQRRQCQRHHKPSRVRFVHEPKSARSLTKLRKSECVEAQPTESLLSV